MVCRIETGRSGPRGFTLIELLVVLAIIATLLSIAYPRYFGTVEHSKEVALKQDLFVLRDAIDKYHADHGEFPPSLQALQDQRYIRNIPEDPVLEDGIGWKIRWIDSDDGKRKLVYDVSSLATGRSRDGELYSSW